MSKTSKCPECGAQLPASAPRGLCPACLLKRGLETNTVGYTQEAARERWAPPGVEELASRFPELEIMGFIGRGGMGAVYKARQKALDRVVALKILPPEMGNDPAFADRFAREAQAMARLNHPHIVTIHEFGHVGARASSPAASATQHAAEDSRAPELYYFVMEYVDGVSLRGLLDSGHVSPKEALAIVPQICEALQYAHEQGIVHRDIKPENILLNKQGQVKIADFGLAKLMGQPPISNLQSQISNPKSQISNSILGTPQYMAPEQLERPADVDHRADIYSLGVVFYQMLTGELPTGHFAPPSRKVQIDVRLDEVVLRALEQEPGRRYQQAGQIKTEVETITQTPASASFAKHTAHSAAFGWEYRSKRMLWGLPLIDVVMRFDPATGKQREARGIIALGGTAKGVIAMGGRAYGVIAFGGFAVGFLAMGSLSVGVLSFGGFAAALLFAYGGLAMAAVAFGGLALGYYSFGGYALGVHSFGSNGIDAEARTFFARLSANWLTALFFALYGAVMCLYGTVVVLGRRWSGSSSSGYSHTPPTSTTATTPPHSISLHAAAIVFGLLYIAFLFSLSQSQALLPNRVATHFGGEGQANDWMNRGTYTLFIAATPLAVAGILWLVGALTRYLPASCINIPRKDYWLAPQRRADTAKFLQRRLLWLACLMLALFAGMHYLTIKANSVTPPHLPMDLFIVLLLAFLLSLIVWIVALLMHLAEPPSVPLATQTAPSRRRYGWIRKSIWKVVIALLVLTLIRLFVLELFFVSGDAVTPEVPLGSRILVYKLARSYSPGDIVVYHNPQGQNRLARVMQAGPVNGKLHVQRGVHGEPFELTMADVVGRVILNTRMGSHAS